MAGVVGGTCAGNGKPSWQAGVPGIPSDGVRDLPDVSLFAANGVWGHYYPVCWSNTGQGGLACTGVPSGWSGGGGTSFAAPILAGIQALVNPKHGHTGWQSELRVLPVGGQPIQQRPLLQIEQR